MKSPGVHPLLLVLGLALAVWERTPAQTISDSAAVEVLPAQRFFPRLPADGAAHQLGAAKDLQSSRWTGAIGAQRPLLQVSVDGCDVQAGIGATVHTGFLRTPPLLQVVTVDFVIDFPVDIRISSPFVLRTGYGHHSAHLADDGVEQLGIRSINYAKDYLMLLAAYALPETRGFVYGGGRWDFHSLPAAEKHWTVQWGAEAGIARPAPFLELYAALDVRFKEEAAWRPTQSYQVGARFFEGPSGSVRLAYTYRTGADDRGQFYPDAIALSLLGVYVDF